MRKVTEQVVSAFLAGQSKTVGNTRCDEHSLYLHGNRIATRLNYGSEPLSTDDGCIRITLAGWNTPTTRERLNGLPGVRVTTKAGQAYLNGQPWGGSWARVPLTK
jgi:hypothetical protein